MTGRAEILRALGALAEPPEPVHVTIAAALGLGGSPSPGDYAEVFLFGVYPYASVYLGPEGMLGGEARDRIAGFWRALGMTPPSEPDHLAALLGLHADLVDREHAAEDMGDAARAAIRRQARKALLWEHLLSWLWPYLDKVVEVAPPYYQAWAGVLRDVLLAEIEDLGPPDRLPLHLREAPGLPEVDASAGEWLGAILAPVRSGIVVTRPDLRRAAATLGVGARVGERAFMLRSLLEQDAPGTLRWLATEADAAAARHQRSDVALGDVATSWRTRAEMTAVALRAASSAGGGLAMGPPDGTLASIPAS